MRKRNKKSFSAKRAAIFIFGLGLFFLPSQGFFYSLFSCPRVLGTRSVAFEIPIFSYPLNVSGVKPPELTSKAVYIVDFDSAVPIYGKNEKIPLLPASTLKIMTALVAIDKYNLDDVLTVGKLGINGQGMDLKEGEQISVRNLLYGLLIPSANDAAVVLAQSYPGGERAFLESMNQRARELHLEGSFFADPTGLDLGDGNGLNYGYSKVTALDLSRLAREAMKNDFISKAVSMPAIDVGSVNNEIVHRLYNVNKLLSTYPGVIGIKTGYTQGAGECLVTLVQKNDHKIILVVLGSEDRFGETTRLIDWVFSNFKWEEITLSS